LTETLEMQEEIGDKMKTKKSPPGNNRGNLYSKDKKANKQPVIELKDVLEYIHYCDSVDIPKLNMALTERVTRFIGEEDD